MIVVYHQNNRVVKVSGEVVEIPFEASLGIAATLMKLAKEYSNQILVWCNISQENNINWDAFDDIFHQDRIMASYNSSEIEYLSDSIGYIDESVFVNVDKKVTYPTWLASSAVGGIRGNTLLQFENKIELEKSFDYFLISLAKIGSLSGLFCYSEPRLIIDKSIPTIIRKASIYKIFQFAKQHYKTRWIFILLLNLLIFERRFPLLAFLFSLRFKKRNKINIDLSLAKVQSKLKVVEEKTIDVIIPTIGRKDCLYDVLKDLASQTHLPKKVIIVEQNPVSDSISELDYLAAEEWPFVIKHIFTHQTGACNARNIALSHVNSEWVFLNDDDNRFNENLINDIFNKIEQFGILVATTSYLQKSEKLVFNTIHQTAIFGSGNSFVKSTCLKNVSFSKALEFGYGEDFDFGMQLRKEGFDVIYFPDPTILHLKAPFGGFRIKPQFLWDNEEFQPKPSPTIMYSKQRYLTHKQIKGYKFRLFTKSLRKVSLFNWFQFYYSFKNSWNTSLKWSEKL